VESNPEESGLLSYAYDVHSQFGEDGLIEEILRRVELREVLSHWCVEFGAWDGRHLSNCFKLIESGYESVLIEADENRFMEMISNPVLGKAWKLNKLVSYEGLNKLDNLLLETPIPKSFDLLSIDIDGCDYHVFDSLEEFRPKVVVIEYNPTIPTRVSYVNQRSLSAQHGSSAKALVDLCERKGYTLVAQTETNLLFVESRLTGWKKGAALVRAELLEDKEAEVFVFAGYDGSLLSNQEHIALRWHGLEVPISKMQILPRFIRAMPGAGRFPNIKKLLTRAWAALRLRDSSRVNIGSSASKWRNRPEARAEGENS
jgi:hypothetical protein